MLPNEKIIPLQSANSVHEEVAPYNVETPPMQKHSKGFIQLPREILEDPRWQSSPLRYQKVFITICMHAVYGAARPFSVGSNLIHVEAGQFCCSDERLVELCNQNVRHKCDKISKNIVQRASRFYSRCHFLIREVIHGTCIFTVSHLTTYETKKYKSDPTSDSKVIQTRSTNEERIKTDKNLKKDEIVFVENVHNFADPSFASFSSEKFHESPKYLEVEKDSKKISEESNILFAFWQPKGWNIKIETFVRWLKKYSPEKIHSNLCRMQEGKVFNIKNKEAWMEEALKMDYAGLEKNKQFNREFIIKFKEKYNIRSLSIKKNQAEDDTTQKSFEFCIPHEKLKEILTREYL